MYQQQLTRAAPHATIKDDETLVQQVYRALDGIGPLRVSGSPVRLQVTDGVVTLRGVVTACPIEVQALEVAQSVRGAQQVRDELWRDSELEIRICPRSVHRRAHARGCVWYHSQRS